MTLEKNINMSKNELRVCPEDARAADVKGLKSNMPVEREKTIPWDFVHIA